MPIAARQVPWLLGLLSVLRLVAWKIGVAPSGPLGSDPALWGLTALDLETGNPPLTVPLYPWLIQALPGEVVSTGLSLSMLSSALLPLAGWWAAKPYGDKIALITGGLVLLLPDGVVMAFQLQPDAMTSLWALLLAGSLLRRTWALTISLTLAGILLREHGAPVFLLVLLLSLLSRGARVRRSSILLVGALVLPVFFGGNPGLNQPWTARSQTAVSLLTTNEKPPHLRQDEWREFREKGPLGRVSIHATRSLNHAADAWAWLLLALAGMAAARRKDLLVATLPVLPVFAALILWSERRHVAIMTPVFVLLASISFGGNPSLKKRQAGAISGLILVFFGGSLLPKQAQNQQAESQAFGPVQATAKALCEKAESEDWILSIDQRLILWCPLPQLSDPTHPEAWKAWLVAPARSVESPWVPVDTHSSEVWFYRLSEEALGKPCRPAAPLERRYLLASGPTPHPAFAAVPMPNSPALSLPAPTACP